MPRTSTIAALATARGPSGIGIVRLSGPDSWSIAETLTRGQPPLVDRAANLRRISDPVTGRVLDQGIVLAMRGPRSYTGEDTVELQLHGSPLLLEKILEACLTLGAEPARAGEFTFRALLAGKLSLLQAEAVRDLVDATSDEELRLAGASLVTDASAPFREVLDLVTRSLAALEGPLDFPDQFSPDDEADAQRVAATLVTDARSRVAGLLAEAQAAERLHHTVTVVIAGSPNVGKSSLMNALLRYPRVIVSDIPGTTRDAVSEEILLGGHRVTLVDTAGLASAPPDALDRLAGEETRSFLGRADIVLVVLDVASGLRPEERDLVEQVRHLPHLIAVNKIDTGPVPPDLEARVGEPVLGISATEGIDIDLLTRQLAKLVEHSTDAARVHQLVTARQAAELQTADRALADVAAGLGTLPADVLAYTLGEAREALLRLLGEHIAPDEILETVFSTFCIGK
ncbi:MAG TPA: tRNA uridine-5-carboxymethylaminomethyl(34) synthesis GTPase MnmE [Candidatus Cryosericum sp.]|nr:tRNA uridine-5-carboxymethylaminomethyl(34) synthesis GTPase MnmE [Candidatus Cryosericum sp.]